MTDPSQPPRFPSWLAPTVVTLLVMHLGLTWIQGSLLHRQNEELRALREDVQILSDTIEQGLMASDEPVDLEPARSRGRVQRHVLRVRRIQAPPPSEEDAARKELQDSADSAKKAVNDAREVQSKLSIEENIRKADEKARIEATEHTGRNWLFIALGAGLVGVLVRAWLRRRG